MAYNAHFENDIRAIYEGLKKGHSKIYIGKTIGMCRNTVARHVIGIREFGLEGWIEAQKKARGIFDPTPYAQPIPSQENNETIKPVVNSRQEPWYAKWGIEFDDGKTLVLKELPDITQILACNQIPFEHEDYLQFNVLIAYTLNSQLIIQAGDLLDMLFREPNFQHPDDMSATEEIEKGRAGIQEMAQKFPNLIVLMSNHVEGAIDKMQRRGRIPSVFLKQWRDVYGIPEGWKIVRRLIAGNFCFEHGHETGKGSRASIREETVRRYKQFNRGGMTMVRAHRHTLSGHVAASEWESQTFNRSIIYIGCGMDDSKVTYSGAGLWNNVLVLDKGATRLFPLEVDINNKWTRRLINGNTGKVY